MKRQKKRDTAPELIVRRLVSSLGARYRIASSSLPGSPDLSNRSLGWAIFVHGCFWHGHRGCTRSTTPKRNSHFWEAKIQRNRLRDRQKATHLRALGIRVLVLWECEISKKNIATKLARFLNAKSTRATKVVPSRAIR